MFHMTFSRDVPWQPVFQELSEKSQTMQVHVTSGKNFYLFWGAKNFSIKKQYKDADMLFFGHITRIHNLISVEKIFRAFLIWSVCGKHSLSCEEKILLLSSKVGAQWNCWSKRTDSSEEAVLARPWCLLQAASGHGWKLISVLSYLRETPWCIHVKSEQKNLLCTGFCCSRLLRS